MFKFITRFFQPDISFQGRCAIVISRVCCLQLDPEEFRDLAHVPGAIGPMRISGGGITKIQYTIFDRHADRVDPTIKQEHWRAFSNITMRISVGKDPEYTVTIEDKEIKPESRHTAPGISLVTHLSNYFPLIPKPNKSPLIKGLIA